MTSLRDVITGYDRLVGQQVVNGFIRGLRTAKYGDGRDSSRLEAGLRFDKISEWLAAEPSPNAEVLGYTTKSFADRYSRWRADIEPFWLYYPEPENLDFALDVDRDEFRRRQRAQLRTYRRDLARAREISGFDVFSKALASLEESEDNSGLISVLASHTRRFVTTRAEKLAVPLTLQAHQSEGVDTIVARARLIREHQRTIEAIVEELEIELRALVAGYERSWKS